MIRRIAMQLYTHYTAGQSFRYDGSRLNVPACLPGSAYCSLIPVFTLATAGTRCTQDIAVVGVACAATSVMNVKSSAGFLFGPTSLGIVLGQKWSVAVR